MSSLCTMGHVGITPSYACVMRGAKGPFLSIGFCNTKVRILEGFEASEVTKGIRKLAPEHPSTPY